MKYAVTSILFLTGIAATVTLAIDRRQCVIERCEQVLVQLDSEWVPIERCICLEYESDSLVQEH